MRPQTWLVCLTGGLAFFQLLPLAAQEAPPQDSSRAILEERAPESANIPAQKGDIVFTTGMGKIIVELDQAQAPVTCQNFRRLIEDHFYDHVCFHRALPNYVVQAGDPNTRFLDLARYGLGGPGYTLPAEIGLPCSRGALVMARSPDPVNPRRESNGSQFFICVEDAPQLDGRYTVFGHVISGLEVVTQISNLPTDPQGNLYRHLELNANLIP